MQKEILKGEYVSPEADVIDICSQGVLCASQGMGIDHDHDSYGYEAW